VSAAPCVAPVGNLAGVDHNLRNEMPALHDVENLDAEVNPAAVFSTYRLPRFAAVPPIEVLLLDRPDIPPAVTGETPIVAVAQAPANAIFEASGVRLLASARAQWVCGLRRPVPRVPRVLPDTHTVNQASSGSPRSPLASWVEHRGLVVRQDSENTIG